MTRQIALGAIIAFSVTVLALSFWEPKNPPTEPPPAPAVPLAPAPVAPNGVSLKAPLLNPTRIRGELGGGEALQLKRTPRAALELAITDAGSP